MSTPKWPVDKCQLMLSRLFGADSPSLLETVIWRRLHSKQPDDPPRTIDVLTTIAEAFLSQNRIDADTRAKAFQALWAAMGSAAQRYNERKLDKNTQLVSADRRFVMLIDSEGIIALFDRKTEPGQEHKPPDYPVMNQVSMNIHEVMSQIEFGAS